MACKQQITGVSVSVTSLLTCKVFSELHFLMTANNGSNKLEAGMLLG